MNDYILIWGIPYGLLILIATIQIVALAIKKQPIRWTKDVIPGLIGIGFILSLICIPITGYRHNYDVEIINSYYTNYKTYTLVNINTKNSKETHGNIGGLMVMGTGYISGTYIQRENEFYSMYVQELNGNIFKLKLPIEKVKFRISNDNRIILKRKVRKQRNGESYYTNDQYYEIHIPAGSIDNKIVVN